MIAFDRASVELWEAGLSQACLIFYTNGHIPQVTLNTRKRHLRIICASFESLLEDKLCSAVLCVHLQYRTMTQLVMTVKTSHYGEMSFSNWAQGQPECV